MQKGLMTKKKCKGIFRTTKYDAPAYTNVCVNFGACVSGTRRCGQNGQRVTKYEAARLPASSHFLLSVDRIKKRKRKIMV